VLAARAQVLAARAQVLAARAQKRAKNKQIPRHLPAWGHAGKLPRDDSVFRVCPDIVANSEEGFLARRERIGHEVPDSRLGMTTPWSQANEEPARCRRYEIREILRSPRKKSRTKRVRGGNLRMTARSKFLVVRPCRTMGGLPRNNIVWSEPEAARWGKTRRLVSAIGARFELLRQLRRKKIAISALFSWQSVRVHLLDQLRTKLFAMSYSLDQEPLPSGAAGPVAGALLCGGNAIGRARMTSSRPWGRSRRAD